MDSRDAAAAVVQAIVAEPAAALLALDFDGTLAPIVDRPEDVRPQAGAADVLTALAARLGAVALISGRPAADVVRLGGFDAVTGLRVAGHYGLQVWQDGRLNSPLPDPGVARARDRLPQLLADAEEGVYVEDKEHSLVVHTRPTTDPQRTLDRLEPALRRLAAEVGLETAPGRFVLELRPAGTDKGSALRTLIDAVDAKVVVYAGDDLGDLPAFAVVAQLRAAGAITGLTIASAETTDPDAPPELRAAADLVLGGPAAVVSWLADLAAQLPPTR